METAAKNAATLQGAGAGEECGGLAVHQVQTKAASNMSTQSFASPVPGLCYRCGGDHVATKCGHKDSKCFHCGKIGHVARVCRSKDKGNSRLNVVRQSEHGSQLPTAVEEGLTDNMYYMSPASLGKSNPTQVSLKMDGQTVSMEVDTSVFIISETEHRRHWPGAPLRCSAIQLRSYTGEPLKVVGGTMVDVIYGQQQAWLPLVIVAGEGPCLMGRDWLQQLQLDWSTIGTIQFSPLQEVLQ